MKLTTFLITIVTAVTLIGCKKNESPKSTATARFTTFQSKLFLNEPITFENTSLNATSYKWNFGDGQTSTAASPQHAYTTPGKHTVTLTVDNNNSVSAVLTILPGSSSYVLVNASKKTMLNLRTYVGYTATTSGTLDRTFGDLPPGGVTDTIYTNAPNIIIKYDNRQSVDPSFTLYIYESNIFNITD